MKSPTEKFVNLNEQEDDNRQTDRVVAVNLDSTRQDDAAGGTSDGTAQGTDTSGAGLPGGGDGGGGGGASASASTSRPPKIVRLVDEEIDVYNWLL